MLFENAANAEPFARPITQYYGVSALARGLAIVLNPDGSEDSLSRGHGLKVGAFADYATDLEMQVSKGPFTDFGSALGGATLRVRTAGPDWYLPLPDIEPTTALRLGAVVALLPGLTREHRQWTGADQPPGFTLSAVTRSDGDPAQVEWKFDGKHSDDELHRLFGVTDAETRGNGVIATAEDQPVPQLAQGFVFDKIGNVTLRGPLAPDVRLSPLQVLFIVSFALSMLARYRPSQWMSVFGGGGNDRMFPFVHSFLEFNQSWFPQLAADHLQFAAQCDYSMIPNTQPVND
jgi:hypothetical protein